MALAHGLNAGPPDESRPRNAFVEITRDTEFGPVGLLPCRKAIE